MKLKEIESVVMSHDDEMKLMRQQLHELEKQVALLQLYQGKPAKQKPVEDDKLPQLTYDALVALKRQEHPLVHGVDVFLNRALYRLITSECSEQDTGLQNEYYQDYGRKINNDLRIMATRLAKDSRFMRVEGQVYVPAENGAPPTRKRYRGFVIFNKDKYKGWSDNKIIRHALVAQERARREYTVKLQEHKRDNEISFR